jgi:hypothetical protein
MDPLTIGAAIGVGKTLYGMYQAPEARKEAKKAEKALLASYEIPESINKMVGEAERRRTSGMPGEELAKAELRESTQSGVSAVKEVTASPTMSIGALNSLFSKEQQNLRRLASERMAYQERAENAYMSVLGTKAGYEARKNAATQGVLSNQYSNAVMKGQGATQNMFSGLQEVAGAFLQDKMSKDRAAEIAKIYGRPSEQGPIYQDDINPVTIPSDYTKTRNDYSNSAWYNPNSLG